MISEIPWNKIDYDKENKARKTRTLLQYLYPVMRLSTEWEKKIVDFTDAINLSFKYINIINKTKQQQITTTTTTKQ